MSLSSAITSVHVDAFDRYINGVCDEMGYTRREVLGYGRKREVVDLRHLLMIVARYEFNLSTPRIGEYFKRDHSTVVHATKKMHNLLSTNQIDLNLRQSLHAADQVMFNQWGHYMKTVSTWLTQKK